MSQAFARDDQPLDQDMGAGMLNDGKAIEQFRAGETGPGAVGDVGWDHERSGGVGDAFTYSFNKSSAGGDYIAVTLAWDREVQSTRPGDNFRIGDDFFDRDFTDSVNNLNLYLLEADENDVNNAVARSVATDSTVEHIFFEVPAGGGDYKIVVQHEMQGDPFALSNSSLETDDGLLASLGIDSRVDFGVAWWAYEPSSIPLGDYDLDGDVDQDDRLVWVSSFGDTVFPGRGADGNRDGRIDAADYTVWRDNLPSSAVAVPEPAAFTIALAAMLVGLFSRRH